MIAYVAAEREFSLPEFAISRIARVYSVVIPALALTIAVDVLFMHVAPRVDPHALLASIPFYQYHGFPKYLVMDLFFGNNLWGLGETAFSNSVYWSMCFEVYYYLIFAITYYLTGKWRIALLIMVLVIVGPWAFLRFHLWAFGCLIYWLHRNWTMPVAAARILFAASAAVLVIDLASDLNLRIDDRLDALSSGWITHSVLRRVLGDTLTGLAVAVNILAAGYAAFTIGRFGRWCAYLASFSFSLYLMHVPLLRLWQAYWRPGPILSLVLVLISVWLLSQFTEKQKVHLRGALARLYARLGPAPAASEVQSMRRRPPQAPVAQPTIVARPSDG